MKGDMRRVFSKVLDWGWGCSIRVFDGCFKIRYFLLGIDMC